MCVGICINQPTFRLELRHGYITTLGIFIELPQVKLSLEFVHESHREGCNRDEMVETGYLLGSSCEFRVQRREGGEEGV